MIGIIPARAGSKGIPNKNIISLNGKPLIYYTIMAALQSNLSEVIVSTDSPFIAYLSECYGATVPGLRPAELSTDTAKTEDVIRYEVGNEVSMLLQPTSPLRTVEDINNALNMYEPGESLISVYEATEHPRIMYFSDGCPVWSGPMVRRQDMEPVFVRNGAIYITIGGKLTDYPILYEMPALRSVNIDEMGDLLLAVSFLNDNT